MFWFAILQSEYQRGVSAWNFDIEDLKAQASLVLPTFLFFISKIVRAFSLIFNTLDYSFCVIPFPRFKMMMQLLR
jgi:hypothetical protein